MCGIYGIAELRPGAPVDANLVEEMGRHLVHRGPDDSGVYAGDGVALGMRRLSIIDLAGGHQPIANEDRSVWVVCNGEIYNFREIRRDLEARGHRFASDSDTEVIVHLYEEYGLDCVKHMAGMFAFALWDTGRSRLVLGRDRLGVKPLYVRRDSSRLIFASEAKAILAVPGVDTVLDMVGLEEYLAFGYVGGARTMFEGMETLPPAALMVIENGRVAVDTYWRPAAESDNSLSDGKWASLVRDKLEEAVAAEMISDVPLGAFLSGGVDSSAVVAMMTKHSDQPIRTYSIGFDTGGAGAFYNELPYAREVSNLFGTEHREILVRPNVAELLPKLLWHMDEPIADSAFITTYLVSEFARRDVTVILSGVGGDELFGGYRRYLGDFYARRYHNLPAWLRRRVVAPLASLLPSDRHSPLMNLSRYARAFLESSELDFEDRYRSYVQVFGADALDRMLVAGRRGEIDSFDQAFQVARGGDGLNRLMRMDLMTQMPNDLLMLTDRMSMATSLECRVPLLNHQLVELAAAIPEGTRIRKRKLKHVLKQALAGVLPARILNRPKRGFGAPMGAWIREELAPLTKFLLSRDSITRRGLFDWREVGDTMARHEARKADHTDHLLALLNFEVWARMYLDGRSPEDVGGEIASETR